uniref:Uncharacterized protein n=1 Tax=Arion vulgaris TaxID=1028688 RepID=A0A0B7AYW0_9EUPU
MDNSLSCLQFQHAWDVDGKDVLCMKKVLSFKTNTTADEDYSPCTPNLEDKGC